VAERERDAGAADGDEKKKVRPFPITTFHHIPKTDCPYDETDTFGFYRARTRSTTGRCCPYKRVLDTTPPCRRNPRPRWNDREAACPKMNGETETSICRGCE
jgi:hypothetical protein